MGSDSELTQTLGLIPQAWELLGSVRKGEACILETRLICNSHIYSLNTESTYDGQSCPLSLSLYGEALIPSVTAWLSLESVSDWLKPSVLTPQSHRYPNPLMPKFLIENCTVFAVIHRHHSAYFNSSLDYL
jgi:hypothetical protein